MNKKNINRPLYTKKVEPYINKDIIKVLIGQRRSGKSFILEQIKKILQSKHNISKQNIVYINKELNSFEDIKNFQNLLDYIQKQPVDLSQKVYIFIDEVQDIIDFEKALRDLQARGDFDIYISGSNAHILSSELSTFLSGRYVEIEVFPLSYNEFLEFHKQPRDMDSFMKYIKYGGLPYLIHLELNDHVVYDYIKNVYASILLKDIVKRYHLRNVHFLENLVLFLANNIGSLVSAKKISDYLKSQQVSISANVVLNYLSFLSSVFFIFDVKRQEIGKKIFAISSKHYFGDLGLRHSILPYNQTDISKVLENIIYLHLRIWGYKVHVGQMQGREIDFVAEKSGKKIYIQVCYIMADQSTYDREFGNLLAIPDNHKKVVVSLDKAILGEYKGVGHMHVLDFLTSFS